MSDVETDGVMIGRNVWCGINLHAIDRPRHPSYSDVRVGSYPCEKEREIRLIFVRKNRRYVGELT